MPGKEAAREGFPSDYLTSVAAGFHRFSRWQFASDGRWEEALHLFPRETEREDRLLVWLEGTSEDVAAELFFSADEGEAFLGLRFPRAREAQLSLARTLIGLDLAPAAVEGALGRTLAALRALSGLEGLFRGEPAFMELGVVNGWKSFGPLRFWEGTSPCPLEALRLSLKRKGSFDGLFPRPLAMEWAFSSPLPHWVGLPVSSSSPDGYRLDLLRAEGLLAPLSRSSLPSASSPFP